jgi:lipid-binding SYLF domain-containing protein
MRRFSAYTLAAIALCGAVMSVPHIAVANDAKDAQRLVESARITFENFLEDKQIGDNLRNLVRRAKAVMIHPQVLRGAFLFGASGGNGVLVARSPETGKWGGPAFYTFGEASFGLQAGGDASEMVLVALTDRGLHALLSDSAKLGGNIGVAAGPVGYGGEAATANLSADIVSYTRNKGLYAGVSVEGAVVAPRDAVNAAFYGKEVTPMEILIKQSVANPSSAPLVTAVAHVANGRPSARLSPSGVNDRLAWEAALLKR